MAFTKIASTTSVVPPEARVALVAPRTSRGPAGEAVALRLTVPENPLRLVTLRKTLLEDPCGIESVVGLAEMLKSGGKLTETVKEPTAVWVSDPLIPVTV